MILLERLMKILENSMNFMKKNCNKKRWRLGEDEINNRLNYIL